jgi:hypothetical protein
MPNEFSPEEQALIDEILKHMKSKDRRLIPSHRVKPFLQAFGDEWKRTGEVKKEFVDQLVAQVKSGEL